MAFTFRWVPTPGQNNNFVNGSVNGGKARAIRDDGQVDPFDSPLYICIPPITFIGGNAGAATLYDFAKLIRTCGPNVTVSNSATDYRGNRIQTGGALTINGNPCGNYEFNVIPTTTLTQTTIATLFSNNDDISTWIVCKGNLNIDAYATLIPTINPNYTPPSGYSFPPDENAKRRLFMVIYVTGTLIFGLNSTISMSACGGNSSSTGANIASFNIPIANNLYYSGLGGTNPTIQSTGGIGGASVSNTSPGNSGASGIESPDGSTLSTGGGGSGSCINGDQPEYYSGSGGNGSPFSGGAGGGSSTKFSGEGTSATDGSSLGGAGGNASTEGAGSFPYAGTGNPGGAGAFSPGLTGTGGVLIIIAEGGISSNDGGTVAANGVDGNQDSPDGGGASGGGIIAIIQGSSSGSLPNNISKKGGAATAGGPGGDGQFYNYGINS